MEIQENRLADSSENQSMKTVDAVARAAHVWIRFLCLTEKQEPEERLSMACGLITGLCGRLELDPRLQELVAYVYALLDDEGTGSLAASRVMLQQSITPSNMPAFKKGLSEATAIVEMFAYHKSTS